MQVEEEVYGANSEMRFITIELMKIAAKRKASFEEVSQEFIKNVYSLEAQLSEGTGKRVGSKRWLSVERD